MKAAIAGVLATLLAGCLTPPTGKDPGGGGVDGAPGTDAGGGAPDGGGGGPWPPADVQILAAAPVDLDGDGTEELVVVAQSGVGVELVALDGATAVRARTTLPGATAPFALRAFDVRAAAAGADVLVAYTSGGTVTMAAHSGTTLARMSLIATGLTASGPGEPWLGDVEFVAGSHHAVVFAGGGMRHARGQTLESGTPTAEMIPAPAGGWTGAQGVGSFTDAGTQTIAVATPTTFVTSPLPGPGGAGAFAWVARRTGETWASQRVLDLDGDARPEVLGVADDGAATLCAGDVDGGDEGCVSVAFPAASTLAVGDVTTDARTDVVATSPNGAMTHVAVRGGLSYTSGTLTTDGELTVDVAIDDGHPVILDRGLAHEVIVVLGRDGGVDCRIEMGMNLMPCPAAAF